ncbi:guanine nucleotide-binding protein G(i) subunit alpha-2 [Exaiptasia diaphana]|uniref:Uncharacterized protein n=1 Tax=Exaiptasia diaphana TaxID=2652724 RepID=A0A913WSE2_EXADI|nr:guanine nucleotide-binding protein G(i) subunit alpha-2 [Exaiptasia diaphana]XP_028512928.1 guanine nucleotide-binding protein G(i) subunit alpha-2 [Exaiptasia diaphana]KXJ18400.1 Guanine nucleotide-binding protein G(i) subunit alpha-2 [Exaiptasia diaphana]
MAELLRSETNLKPSELKAAYKRSQHIDALLDKEREERQQEIQILTLGSGGSGKSTFIKQLKIVYDNGYNDEERQEFRSVIYRNIYENVCKITRGLEKIGLHFDDENVKSFAEGCVAQDDSNCDNNNAVFSPVNKADVLEAFWKESCVQECYKKRSLFHIDETSKYFFTDINRLAKEDYVPEALDILRVRDRTQGVVERNIKVNDYKYRVIDVEGQKSQRKKWIHFFDGVTAVVFFASLSSYDEVLEEDEAVNAMRDNLDLFEEISNCEYLSGTQFILFLNKQDLFKEKLTTSPLSDCFPDYEGGADYEKAVSYVKQEFLSRKPADKDIFVHVTCATDTDPMKTVLQNVFEILVEINLKKIAVL